MKKICIVSISLLFGTCFAQQLPGRLLFIPDIQGFKTLKCDFHMHTVFSDGLVWPTIRVEEAWKEGLDAIAISDHIEYKPFKEYVSQDLNKPYEIAKIPAEKTGLILIRSLEITRSMPPGHLNALFLTAVDSLKKENYTDVLKSANDQGAFVFWNHPGWKPQAPDGIKWYDVHTELLNKGLFQGIEVVNGDEYYPEALEWCMEKNLTILGNTDMHGSSASYLEQIGQPNRPMTLVFAKEKSVEGIREALINRRTAIWFENKIIGSVLFLESLFQNSIISSVVYRDDKSMNLKLSNLSDIEISFQIKGGERSYVLYPRSNIILQLKPDTNNLEVTVTSFITGKDKFLNSTIRILQ